ncbi:M13 family peptidase [Massilia arenosa]|uniref:M13 family peptidase n=1 Tax=Zemynaea arenosa TaxID=2561931 RepID=A0A4Y9SSA9_9BURK|nr:M13 family metallopeptidase [Massilia arenosa]TFW27636.1 M13 family peptidase [Massilia arenosa]
MQRHLLTTLALSLATAFATSAGAADKAPVSGIDTQFVDKSVRVQDNFYDYLNGGWMKTTEIPGDRSSWGTFAKMREDVTPQVRGLIEDAQKDKAAKAGTNKRKIGDFYASYMDEKKADQLGYKPLAGELQRIRALKGKKGIPQLMAHLAQIGVSGPYGLGVGQDAKDSTRYAVHISQSGLGMPDRDYYLKKDDAKLADVRAKYVKHVESMLALAGEKDAAQQAQAILALETALAEVQWTKVANRDANKRYNKFAIADLDQLAPGYDWKGALAAAGVGGKTDYVIVSQPSYIEGFNKVLASTDLATWKSYFEWQLLRSYAEYLSKPFVDANFDFYGKTLTGVTEQRPRWKRAAADTEGALGEAVGQLYVDKYFPAERKARMEALVKNLLAAYKESINQIDWMSPATKEQAQAKLATFTYKIGYPNKWRDYSKLQVVKGDLVGNEMRAATFAYNRNISKLGQPIDREEWGMTPQTINAYYRPTMNEIVFPAAILQPPFFDASADDAVNYGAIGAVIGHEISHGFDDNGSKYDGSGNLRDWWTADDRKNFMVKAEALAAQYDGYSPIKGYNVNGHLTLGENIADNSGLAIAYKAYKISLKGQSAPVIDGLSGDQRFYLGFGQVWRAKMREEQQIVQLKTDPHSPGVYRANGTVVNQPGFYEAFGVKEGDKMYVAPEKRVIIW